VLAKTNIHCAAQLCLPTQDNKSNWTRIATFIVPNTVPLPAKDAVMIGEGPAVSNLATHFTRRKERYRENRAKIDGEIGKKGDEKEEKWDKA
jgi:hypothetical protein